MFIEKEQQNFSQVHYFFVRTNFCTYDVFIATKKKNVGFWYVLSKHYILICPDFLKLYIICIFRSMHFCIHLIHLESKLFNVLLCTNKKTPHIFANKLLVKIRPRAPCAAVELGTLLSCNHLMLDCPNYICVYVNNLRGNLYIYIYILNIQL